MSCMVCRLSICDLDDRLLNLLVAWEIRSFCRRGTSDSLKLSLLLFSLSLKEVLLSRAVRPSKLRAFPAAAAAALSALALLRSLRSSMFVSLYGVK